MSKKPSYFDRIFIANPCPVDWNKMTGNDQMRYCSECNKQVYNLSKMTRDRAEALVARFEGRLCARIERGDDGAIMTEERSSDIQLISRRASPVASAVVTAILSLSGSAVAATSLQANEPVAIHAQSRDDKNREEPHDIPVSLSGTVFDPQGAVIVSATIVLTDETTGEHHLTISSDDGAYRFASLPGGSYSMKVEAGGFRVFQKTNLELQQNENKRLDVNMDVTRMSQGEIVMVPQTLRALYRQSENIVVARIGKPVQARKKSNDNLMKTALEITSTIKGGGKKTTIYVYHYGWGEDPKFPGGFTNGDTVLAFLKERNDGDGYEVIDTSSGVKKLSEADLSIYLQRIEELAAIPPKAKPDMAAIVEWLVRCAEQPATRWEGTYELATSVGQVGNDANDADEVSVEAVEPDSKSGQQADEPAATCNKAGSDSNFAARLTDQQKGRLKAALFNTAEMKESDLQLVELVKSWKDEQLVPYLVSQLRRIEAAPPRMAQQVMTIIAELLRDEEVTNLTYEYSGNASYEDLAQEENEIERIGAATAKQRRSELLKRFLAAVEKKIEKRA
jgi:hypothetical protein